jgi:hypothetical protein
MPVATLIEIKNKFDLKDNNYYSYSMDNTGSLNLKKVNDYELLAEEGLKKVYDDEPDGLWEKCLES